MYLKMVPPPPPDTHFLEAQGDFFLWYLLWAPGQAPGGKTQRSVAACLSFLSLRLVHTELQQFINYSSDFPTLTLFPGEVSALIKLGFSVSVCLSPQFWGAVVGPLTLLLWSLWEELLIFRLFGFWPFIRMEWLHLSPLHAGWETEVLFCPFLGWVVLFLTVEF